MKAQAFTLIEMMITIVIIAILGAIAIPAYIGYVDEAQFGTARANANSLRVFMEEYFLENNSYIVGGDITYDKAELEANFGWRPDGDNNNYEYTVTAEDQSWHIEVEHISSGNWVRCENRMSICCYGDETGSSSDPCP